MKIDLSSVAIEITFDAKMGRGTKRVNFYRELYGYKRFSKFGKYIYFKDGVLSNIKYLKPTKSTIIVSIKDAKVVRKFLKKHNTEVDEKMVILNETEAKELGLKVQKGWRKIYEDLKGNENMILSVDF